MAPKKDSASVDNTDFLLSCLLNLEKVPKWADIAAINGISGTDAVGPGPTAQRRFKRIVDASEKFNLVGGKVVLKDTTSTDQDDDNADDAASTSEKPASKPPTKKRGRPAGSTNKSNKKAKATKKEETPEADTNTADDDEE